MEKESAVLLHEKQKIFLNRLQISLRIAKENQLNDTVKNLTKFIALFESGKLTLDSELPIAISDHLYEKSHERFLQSMQLLTLTSNLSQQDIALPADDKGKEEKEEVFSLEERLAQCLEQLLSGENNEYWSDFILTLSEIRNDKTIEKSLEQQRVLEYLASVDEQEFKKFSNNIIQGLQALMPKPEIEDFTLINNDFIDKENNLLQEEEKTTQPISFFPFKLMSEDSNHDDKAEELNTDSALMSEKLALVLDLLLVAQAPESVITSIMELSENHNDVKQEKTKEQQEFLAKLKNFSKQEIEKFCEELAKEPQELQLKLQPEMFMSTTSEQTAEIAPSLITEKLLRLLELLSALAVPESVLIKLANLSESHNDPSQEKSKIDKWVLAKLKMMETFNEVELREFYAGLIQTHEKVAEYAVVDEIQRKQLYTDFVESQEKLKLSTQTEAPISIASVRNHDQLSLANNTSLYSSLNFWQAPLRPQKKPNTQSKITEEKTTEEQKVNNEETSDFFMTK